MKANLYRILAGLTLGVGALHATTTSTTEIQGSIPLAAAANSDTLMATPFGLEAAWQGTVQSATSVQLTMSGSPGWSSGAYAPGASTYYVRLLSGALNGHYFVVTANDGSSVTVDNAGLDLTQIASGDQIELAPFWTLGTLYPSSSAGVTFTVSSSALAQQTQLLFFNPAGTGTNRAPSATYFYYNGAWRKVGSPVTASFNSTVVYPDTYFLQRNKGTANTVALSGRVFSSDLSTLIDSNATTKQDNYVALAFPVDVTLGNSGLAGSGAFATSGSALTPSDELLLFTPGQTGINHSASAAYFYYNSGWRLVGGDVSVDYSNSVVITAGSGFIIRKAVNSGSGSWVFQTNL
jgi:uncharacterized protein (TIGR02597 family)